MRIDRARSSVSTLSGKPSAAASADAFSIPGESHTDEARSAGIATIGLTAVLALQDNGEALSHRRKKLLRRGVALLDALDDIKRDLVGGGQPDAKFEALRAALTPSSTEDLDPEGRALIRAIEVRAAVELAKNGR